MKWFYSYFHLVHRETFLFVFIRQKEMVLIALTHSNGSKIQTIDCALHNPFQLRRAQSHYIRLRFLQHLKPRNAYKFHWLGYKMKIILIYSDLILSLWISNDVVFIKQMTTTNLNIIIWYKLRKLEEVLTYGRLNGCWSRDRLLGLYS